MSYTPSQTFAFTSGGSYTPGTTFDFNDAPQAELSLTLDNAALSASVYQSPSADLSATLDNAVLSAVAKCQINEATLSLTLDSASFTAQAANAPQGVLQFPIQTYTPNPAFTFANVAYSISTSFNFDPHQVTLDDAVFNATGNYYDNGASLSLNLDDATPTASAQYVQNRAQLSVTLDDLSLNTVAVNAPQATFSATLDDAILNSPVKYITNRASVTLTLEDASLNTVAVNAPQGQISLTLDEAGFNAIAVNAPQTTLNSTLQDSVFTAQGNCVDNVAQAHITLDDAAFNATGDFDYNTIRYLIGQTIADLQNARQHSNSNLIQRDQAGFSPIKTDLTYTDASRIDSDNPIITNQAEPIRQELSGTSEQATRIEADTGIVVEQMTRVHRLDQSEQDQAEPQNARVCALSQQMTPIRKTEWTVDYQDTGRSVKVKSWRRYLDGPNPYTPNTAFTLNEPEDATGHFTFTGYGYLEFIQTHWLGIITTPHDAARQYATPWPVKTCSPIDEARRPPPGVSPWIDPPRPPPPVIPDQETITIPEQPVYTMQHTLSVTLTDLTPIAVQTVSLSLDADSYAWQFSADLLDKTELDLVTGSNGEPVTLIVTINGIVWHVLVERIEHSRRFANRNIRLSGRGLSALLGTPYQTPASATQGDLLAIQQLAALHIPNGWTLNWNHVTWNIPGGAYSYTHQTPIQALMRLVSDSGAMLIPARDSQTITVKPRYPVLPWSFDGATPDVIIPESAIVELSQRPFVPQQANGVYVHGGEIGGVIGWCRLNGSDGAKLAPTVSNNLITDVIAARALGERILAGQAEQPAIQSATLPLDNDTFPLLDIGDLVQITVDSNPIRGIVNSVSINASLASVRQTVQLGEDTPNTWILFKDLLPNDPLLVATLSSTDGVTSLMTLLDGGVVRVRGTGDVNGKYYIRSGKIDSDAPDLTQSEIVV